MFLAVTFVHLVNLTVPHTRTNARKNFASISVYDVILTMMENISDAKIQPKKLYTDNLALDVRVSRLFFPLLIRKCGHESPIPVRLL